MMKKATSRQYSTEGHDEYTMTKEEYDKMNKPSRHHIAEGVKKVFMHKSVYAGPGEKVW